MTITELKSRLRQLQAVLMLIQEMGWDYPSQFSLEEIVDLISSRITKLKQLIAEAEAKEAYNPPSP